jgi:CHAT domain-containing protein
MNQASGDTLQKGLSLMAEPIERLVASAECRGVVPSEQLMLDSMQTSLLFARMMLVSGNTKEAYQIANHIIETFDTFQRDPNFTLSKQGNIYLDSLALSAYCSKKQGSAKAAQKLVQDWLKNYKTRINETIQGASEQQRMRFATQQQPFDFVASMEDPLAVAEMSFFSKGAVLESLMTQKKVVSQTVDVDLKNQMEMIQKLKSQLQGQGESQANALQKLGEKERTLAENVRRSFKESDILEILKSSDFRAIPKSIPSESAFIDYIQFSEFDSLGKGPRRYAAIVINDKGKLTFQKLAPVSEVDSLISKFRNAVALAPSSENDKKLDSICSDLHNLLIAPINSQLKGAKNIIICPDGSLNFVPFGAFIDKNNQFLLQNMAVRYVASGRDLLRSISNNPAKEMLVLANPDFNGSNPPAPETFLPLPGTKREADAISTAMRDSGFNVQNLEQTQATEGQLKAAKSPRILHIATHGFNLSSTHGSESDPSKRGMKIKAASSEQLSTDSVSILPNEPNPMFRTGLALSKANDTFSAWVSGKQPPSDNDGILQAGEVPTIDLSGTWIVVLSACQTGEGEAMGGEGVFGLKRGFLQAGANNLLMTLWPIADKETSEMMTDFYKKIADGSTDPGRSLSEIQKDWITRLRSEHGTTFAINRAAPFILTAQGKISQ